jgi:SAM-dependent methyltransferase
MGTEPVYDTIGRTYSTARVEDARIRAQILEALGDAPRVVNVGAGTGNYEPREGRTAAADPAGEMLRQRAPGAGPAVQAVAEALPFPGGSFDAALAIFTLHHWSDVGGGLQELARVAPRQVLLYCEPLGSVEHWLLEYFPAVEELATEQQAPGRPEIEAVLLVDDVATVWVPPDCTDGFTAAYWARPEAYLDPVVQSGMSSLALLDPAVREAGTAALREDLASGRWEARFGHLRRRPRYDGGYRLATCRS